MSTSIARLRHARESQSRDRLATLSDIRRLLISGAMVIVRWACRKGTPEGSWLHRMLARKPRMLVAIAIANKMARSIWAMLTKGEDYRVPVAVTA